jgi:hypothetical protein
LRGIVKPEILREIRRFEGVPWFHHFVWE